jgi:hypothetical protein
MIRLVLIVSYGDYLYGTQFHTVDIIKINKCFCDSPLMFYLFVQQKNLKTAAPVSINTLKTHTVLKHKRSPLICREEHRTNFKCGGSLNHTIARRLDKLAE